MVRFLEKLRLRSQQKMTDFRDNKANSRNGSQSYACNLKTTGRSLVSEIIDKFFDMIRRREFFFSRTYNLFALAVIRKER